VRALWQIALRTATVHTACKDKFFIVIVGLEYVEHEAGGTYRVQVYMQAAAACTVRHVKQARWTWQACKYAHACTTFTACVPAGKEFHCRLLPLSAHALHCLQETMLLVAMQLHTAAVRAALDVENWGQGFQVVDDAGPPTLKKPP